MTPVIIESPYASNVVLNLQYLRACLRDALQRGETPYASHAVLTQPGVLRDEMPEERATGIRAGYEWRPFAKLTAIYEDLGWSGGMYLALEDCERRNLPFERRTLGPHWRRDLLLRARGSETLEHWLNSFDVTPADSTPVIGADGAVRGFIRPRARMQSTNADPRCICFAKVGWWDCPVHPKEQQR